MRSSGKTEIKNNRSNSPICSDSRSQGGGRRGGGTPPFCCSPGKIPIILTRVPILTFCFDSSLSAGVLFQLPRAAVTHKLGSLKQEKLFFLSQSGSYRSNQGARRVMSFSLKALGQILPCLFPASGGCWQSLARRCTIPTLLHLHKAFSTGYLVSALLIKTSVFRPTLI